MSEWKEEYCEKHNYKTTLIAHEVGHHWCPCCREDELTTLRKALEGMYFTVGCLSCVTNRKLNTDALKSCDPTE